MPNIFLEFVRLSLIGSLFAGAVMLVRLVFRKAPKWLICVLWGIVALRLICPISIESNFSLVPGRIANGEILTDIGSAYIGEVDRIYENDAEYHDAIESGGQPVYSNDGYYIVTEKDSFEVPKTVGMAVYPVFSWIWASGVIAMLAYTAVSYLILKKKMAEATLLRDNIWQCNQAESPFVLGIIKPQIYIPYWITDSDLANVIAHEQAHIERKDHWWKPVGFLLLSLYWFNPVLWIAYVMLCRDIEAACDEKVIRHMEKEEIRVYSTALLNCSIHRRRIAACPLAFGEEGVKERIKRIMCYKKPTFWMITAAVVACIAVGVCFMTSPKKPRNQPPKIPEESLEAGPVEIIGTKTYYQNPDGTWQANGRNYKYRLEISGTMPNAAAKSTFVYLSNIEIITFTQAWKAAGFSSNTEDYFPAEEALLVDWSTEESASGTQTDGTDPSEESIHTTPGKLSLEDIIGCVSAWTGLDDDKGLSSYEDIAEKLTWLSDPCIALYKKELKAIQFDNGDILILMSANNTDDFEAVSRYLTDQTNRLAAQLQAEADIDINPDFSILIISKVKIPAIKNAVNCAFTGWWPD